MECVIELLQAGADVNLQKIDGWTALILASRNCNKDSSMECVRELLKAGADWTMSINIGLTAKDLAPESQKTTVKKLIKQAKREEMKKEILKELNEQLWEYGGIGFELLQLKHQLLGMQ